MDEAFPKFWTYVDESGTQSRVDITKVFNQKRLSKLRIEDAQADVLAAGAAKRLGASAEETSKGAIDVVGKPLASYLMGKAAMDGVKRILIAALGYWNRRSLYDVFGTGEGLSSIWGVPKVDIAYQKRESPHGSADCVMRNLQELGGDRPTFILQLDNVFGEFDFRTFLEYSKQKGAFMTLALTEVDDPSMYGTVRLDESGRVTGMCEKSVLTLTDADARRLNPYDAVSERLKITPGFAAQLGLAPESVGYTHILTHQDAGRLDYNRLVGGKVSLSIRQMKNLGYNKVNCGLYYLAPGARLVLNSQECRDFFVREGTDIGGNLIGWLVGQGFPVVGYDIDEHSKLSRAKGVKVMWRDAGFPRELLETSMDVAQGKVTYNDIPGRVGDSDVYISPGATDASGKARENIIRQMREGEIKVDTSKGNVVIGEDVEISHGVTVEGPAYIGRQSKIGVKNQKVNNRITISGSSIGWGSRIGDVDEIAMHTRPHVGNHVCIRRSIIGEHCIILGSENKMAATTVVELETQGLKGPTYTPSSIGSGCRISAGSRLEGVEISPHMIVEEAWMIGAKYTTERTPILQPTTPAQEAMRRRVEFSTPDPSPYNIARMREYQLEARKCSIALNAPDMLFAIGRAEGEIRKAATLRQAGLSAENARHQREMISLYRRVKSIESAENVLDMPERVFANSVQKLLKIEGALNPRDSNGVKAIRYLNAVSNLLERGERKSSDALLNKALERANLCADDVVKRMASGLEPRLRKEIELSTMIKAIERSPLVEGDQDARRKFEESLSATAKSMLEPIRAGLLPPEKVIGINEALARQRKRLEK